MTDTTAHQKMAALKDLQRFANSFPGFFAVLKDIANLGTIEQAIDEAKARLSKTNSEHELALRRIDDAKAATDQAIVEKHATADLEIANRKAQAETEHNRAAEEAAKKLEAARASVITLNKRADALNEHIERAQSALADIGVRTANANSEFSRVTALIAQAHAEHVTVREKLAAFVASIATKE